MKLHYYLFLLVLLGGCIAFQKTVIDNSMKPLSDSAEVAVVDVKQPIPDSAKLLATLKYSEGSPKLSYNQFIDKAKKEARILGGNLIKVTDLYTYQAYTLEMSVFYRPNIHDLDARLKAIADSLHRLKFGNNPNFAILYIYRPPHEEVISVGYDIKLNDKFIGRSTSNSFFQLKIYQEGPAEIQAHTDAPTDLSIDVKFGEEYYVRCGLIGDALLGKPVFEVMSTWKGSIEYARMENINMNKDK